MTNQPKRCAVCGKFTAKQELYCKNHVYEAMVANRDEWKQIAMGRSRDLLGRDADISRLEAERDRLKSQLEGAMEKWRIKSVRIGQLEAINKQHQALVDGLRSDIAGLVELSERKGLWTRFTRLLRFQI